jgi:hypothetical protein
MPPLVGAVLGLCAPCAQVPSPRLAALQRQDIDNWLILGPHKSGDIVVPRVLLLVRVGRGASRPCACTA